MITRHSINLKYVHDPCFAFMERSKGCRVLIKMHEGCGSYKCPFYKPKDCADWVRIEDRMGVNLIPPEDLGGKMDKDKYYKVRRYYVEDILGTALKPMQDFEAMKYAYNDVTGEEYVRITDTIGGKAFLDITGMALNLLLKDVAKIVLNSELHTEQMPLGLIVDEWKLREIAPLFK